MPILRKVCQQCTSAKAKCIIETPRCRRCTKRGLPCTYDLLPLTTPCYQPKHRLVPEDSIRGCILRTLKSRAGIDPMICEPGQAKSVDIIRLGYQSIPNLLRVGKPALCIHPKLQVPGASVNHLSALADIDMPDCAGGCPPASYEAFRRLIDLDFEVADLYEQLTALQTLLVYIATVHFPMPSTTDSSLTHILPPPHARRANPALRRRSHPQPRAAVKG
jgi:hypothetical protein